MNKTENYQLSQWEKTDRIMMDDFNSDNEKIDAALKALAKTSAEHTAALAGLGNCQLYAVSYTGTGTYGSDNPNRLTFPKTPYLVAIASQGQPWGVTLLLQGQTGALMSTGEINGGYALFLTWSGNTLQWYVSGGKADAQLNNSGTTYLVVALMKA